MEMMTKLSSMLTLTVLKRFWLCAAEMKIAGKMKKKIKLLPSSSSLTTSRDAIGNEVIVYFDFISLMS